MTSRFNGAPIALTCGEPAGIGPELAETVWQELQQDGPAFFLIGDATHLPGNVPHIRIDTPSQANAAMPDGLPVLHMDFGAPRIPGTPNPTHAKAVIKSIETAVQLAQDGAASGICTLPIHKKALKDGAGFAFPGHTEFLGHLGGVDNVVMMLASPLLRVVPVTIHIALADVPAQLTPALLEATIRITHAGLKRDFGLDAPRLAIAGLNPHAGEGGVMGHEDMDVIAPTLEKLISEGMDIRGPLPADTMFHARARDAYDVAICMYHDQALIPIKALDFDRGVNVTLGLPFVRTSPDHGTAFDIAGQGIANPASTLEALRLAAKMGSARIQDVKEA
ncbi:4-hydroxythreonine-4-phosphate dehydrogenase PdxA [Halocynthiibacter namhaensis]|uniref:4-hydroxythreonine-4-phosphate dehydrogenase PdxA n=1 Tax=Halocynthiibacter namhaensis TaxID=1290553 RepID=UPI0005792EFF|nr:4-hydroxythreonine-4-phosphate dehydrogenase PdxA [Halocynthiibacter namhaensis]